MGFGMVMDWTDDPLTTVPDALVYATERGWADWLALTAGEPAIAILDASTFIKATYRAPQTVSASQAKKIADAATEAARLTLSGPLIGFSPEPQVVREKIDTMELQYAEAKPGAAQKSRLALVSAMLRSAGLLGGSSINVPLRKA